MPKILVKKPVVDINGDEMARVIWAKIKKELISILKKENIKNISEAVGINA